MPGQAVTNRPIMMSLVVVPIRAAFDMPSQLEGDLPKLKYVGLEWPDFTYLLQDHLANIISLSVGCILNSLIILGGAVFAINLFGERAPSSLGVLLLVISSPYFLFQTMFVWPKEMAGFFIALSVLFAGRFRKFYISGLFCGVAYLCHPYSLAFVIGLAVYVFFSDGPAEDYVKAFNKKIILFLVLLAGYLSAIFPWIIWSKVFLRLPSDLIGQNLFLPNQSIADFIWVRAVNLMNTLLPVYWLNYPFNLKIFLLGSAVNFAGAIGILFYLFFIKAISNTSFKKDRLILCSIFLPTILIIFIFSNQAVPALHGLQFPILLALIAGVYNCRKSAGKYFFSGILFIQVTMNITLLYKYFWLLM